MIAFTREVPPSIERCELTHLAREPIDLQRARAEHQEYERALRELGVDVRRLSAAPELPDSVFVEDTAVVLDELAVITRPGASSRHAELDSVRAALAPLRSLHLIEQPGTLDGGDVLVLDRELLVGLSGRTNEDGARQLATHIAPFGYTVRTVSVDGCLHLKSAVTSVGDDLLLVNPAWVDPATLGARPIIECDPAEPYAANALRVGDVLLHPAAYTRTRSRLERHGCRVYPVPADELAKAEGGVTCCCLLLG